jgi:biopolymer transport protein ExbD
MRYKSRREPPGQIAFNATPLFDMMFTLTIFFMLVCRLSSAEQVRMELPKPAESQAEIATLPDRVIINCRLGRDPQTAKYSIGPNAPQPLNAIAERLVRLKRRSPNLEAVVRADKRLHYSHVRAAMRVVAESGIKVLNVVAHVGEVE